MVSGIIAVCLDLRGANSEPSGPRHSTRQGFLFDSAGHESSVAHLGQIFSHLGGYCNRVAFRGDLPEGVSELNRGLFETVRENWEPSRPHHSPQAGL